MFGIILCFEVRKSHSLYIYIYNFRVGFIAYRSIKYKWFLNILKFDP